MPPCVRGWGRSLAREALPPSMAFAARDSSTLSGLSQAGPVGEGVQVMLLDKRRWIKLVAHVVRRLWEIEGRSPQSTHSRPGQPGWPIASPFSPGSSARPATGPGQTPQPRWVYPGGAADKGRGGAGTGGRDGDMSRAGMSHSMSSLLDTTVGGDSAVDSYEWSSPDLTPEASGSYGMRMRRGRDGGDKA
ncbi:unnamed protein product, partial [Discosporangium mesarthrocarpum]